jgi:hypothetical protein
VEHDTAARVIGKTGGPVISVGGVAVPVFELAEANEGWLPTYMGEEMSGH